MDELLLENSDSLELEDGTGNLLLETSTPPAAGGFNPAWALNSNVIVGVGTVGGVI